MRIGLDFDNTLACYEHVFPAIAKRNGFVPNDFRGGKRETRAVLRAQPSGEQTWMRLQGMIYGQYMQAAEMFSGVDAFLEACRLAETQVYIVSHKTQFGHFDEKHVDLRKAALTWMEEHVFFDANGFAIKRDDVFFTDTRDEKIERIRALELDVYIDDLEEVLSDPSFPASTRGIQFNPQWATDTQYDWPVYTSWQAIKDSLFPEQSTSEGPPLQWVAETLGTPCPELTALAASGNNTAYKVKSSAGDAVLKLYHHSPLDPRDRLGAEHDALTFLETCGETATPRMIAASPAHSAALLSWIAGEAVTTISDQDVKDAASFATRLNGYAQNEAASDLPPASEACLSNAELIDQVETRFRRLTNVACLHPELETFLSQSLRPAAAEQRAHLSASAIGEAPALDRRHQTLSPSDFGFHNALRGTNGDITFIDFEYFGWDDPVKLTADFLLHPGMTLTAEQKQLFLNHVVGSFSADPAFAERLKLHYPLYALRWCGIILNPFVARLRTAAKHLTEDEIETLRTTRLERARMLFDTVFMNNRSFPYVV